MTKKLFLVSFALGFALTACVREQTSDQAQASPEQKSSGITLTTWDQNIGNGIIQDDETGCQYLISSHGGITPRLQSNGQPACGQQGETQ